MKYITGLHALSLPCKLNTSGKFANLRWSNITVKQSERTIFGTYGIEENRTIPNHNKRFNVANHIRAILDILVDGDFSLVRDMGIEGWLDKTVQDELFRKALEVMNTSEWVKMIAIDKILEREYKSAWIEFIGMPHKKRKGLTIPEIRNSLDINSILIHDTRNDI